VISVCPRELESGDICGGPKLTTNSREAASDCSPRRKPWIKVRNEEAPTGERKFSGSECHGECDISRTLPSCFLIFQHGRTSYRTTRKRAIDSPRVVTCLAGHGRAATWRLPRHEKRAETQLRQPHSSWFVWHNTQQKKFWFRCSWHCRAQQQDDCGK